MNEFEDDRESEGTEADFTAQPSVFDDATAGDAGRRRRFRALAQIVGAVSLVCAVGIGASIALGGHDASPEKTAGNPSTIPGGGATATTAMDPINGGATPITGDKVSGVVSPLLTSDATLGHPGGATDPNYLVSVGSSATSHLSVAVYANVNSRGADVVGRLKSQEFTCAAVAPTGGTCWTGQQSDGTLVITTQSTNSSTSDTVATVDVLTPAGLRVWLVESASGPNAALALTTDQLKAIALNGGWATAAS